MRDFLIFIILIVLLLHIARLSKLDTDLSAYVSDLQEQIDEIYNEQHPDEYLIRQEFIKKRDGD